MKSWQKVIVGGASLTLASTLLVGCGSGSKDKKEAGADSKTIKLWVPTGSKNHMQISLQNLKKILVTPLKWLNQKIQKHKKNQKRCLNCCRCLFTSS